MAVEACCLVPKGPLAVVELHLAVVYRLGAKRAVEMAVAAVGP